MSELVSTCLNFSNKTTECTPVESVDIPLDDHHPDEGDVGEDSDESKDGKEDTLGNYRMLKLETDCIPKNLKRKSFL